VLPNQMHIYWTTMIVLYPYITGIVAGAFIISSLHHVFDRHELEPVSRFAMIMAFAFLLFATLPLMAHLGHPERAFNMMFTPNATSAMAGFGFIYSTYLLILAVEIWLLYRADFVFLSQNARHPLMRKLYWLLALGVMDVSPEAKALDRKVMIFLASIGIPAACGLHGYVGFIFGAIKANPWWASPLMPVIFLLSAIVSGIAMVLVCYLVVQWVKGREINGACVFALIESVWYFLIIDVTLELLELLNHAYMANEDWEILKALITTKLFTSFFIIQILLGSVIPFFLLGSVVVFKDRISPSVRNAFGAFGGVLLLMQVAAMRWNVVMGGQMFSKSLRGFLNFDVEIYGREGLIVAGLVLCLPFVTMFVISRILPLWGPLSTFPKEWMKEVVPERKPLKGYSKFS
ncbi:MAG: polysulfide reductase NrfD, partial [Gemmatimonadetes bacterium]|nr:polysulfide reductase NrfD [Gemmatimonadota bacterium]